MRCGREIEAAGEQYTMVVQRLPEALAAGRIDGLGIQAVDFCAECFAERRELETHWELLNTCVSARDISSRGFGA